MDSPSKPNDGGWGEWFRRSSDKWLLTTLILGMMTYNLHIMHDKADNAQIQFVNGLINNIMGALLVLVTSAFQAAKTTAVASTKEDPRTGVTTGTLEIKTPKEGE